MPSGSRREEDEAGYRAALLLLERAQLMIQLGRTQLRYGALKPAAGTLREALEMLTKAWEIGQLEAALGAPVDLPPAGL